jgi:hypothetical protein
VTPVQGGPQGLLPRLGGPATLCQQIEGIFEPCGDQSDGHGPRSCRRQLDGEGYTVELVADSGYRRGVARGEREVGQAGAVREEPHGIVGHQVFGGRDPVLRKGERAHPPDDLPRDAQGLPARGEYAQARAGGEERVGEVGGGLDQVLAIVHHQQRLAVLECLDEGLEKRTARLLAHPEDAGHRLRNEAGLGERRELHQPRPVRIGRDDAARCLHGQPRLARTAHSCQGQKPGCGEHPPGLGDLASAPDETGQRGGQIVPAMNHRRWPTGGGQVVAGPYLFEEPPGRC